MLRSNLRLIFPGLAAITAGLACGWALFAVLPGKTAAPTMQTAAITPAIAPKVTAPVPSAAVPAAEPEPAVPAAPAPLSAPAAEPAPSASTAPPAAPTAGERTKEVARVRGKQRVARRDDDDDDDD